MQRELDYLKQQFQGTADVSVEAARPWRQPRQDDAMVMLPLQSPVSNTYSTVSGTESCEENSLDSSTSLNQFPTLPRMLDGREYDAQRIDDCFIL